MKNFEIKIMYLTNFIFQSFFSYRILPNLRKYTFLINHGSFFQGKDSLQLDCLQFFKINSLMAAAIKKQFL